MDLPGTKQFRLLTNLKPDTNVVAFIKNLPAQLIVPGPTDLSYNRDDKFTWKYDNKKGKYPASGFYLHNGIGNANPIGKTLNVAYYTLTAGTYTLKDSLKDTFTGTTLIPGTTYYLHGITSVYDKSLRFSKITVYDFKK